MNLFTRISWILLILMASASWAQPGAARAVPELMFMMPMVIDQRACLGSLLATPAERCMPWTQREVAGPLYLRDRQEVIIGGKSGYLQAIQLSSKTTLKTKKLSGNLIAKPIEAGGRLFFGLDSGWIQSVDVSTFADRWQQPLDAGVSASVTVFGDKVIAVSDAASIYAFDADKGTVLWVSRRPWEKNISLPYFGSPLVKEMKIGALQGTFVVYGHPSGRLDFIDLMTGKSEFEIMIGLPSAPFADVVAAPLWLNGVVIAAGFNSGIVAVDPVAKTKLWSVEEKGISRLDSAEDMVVAAGPKKIVGLSGGEQQWRFEFDRGEPTSLVINDGMIYFGADGDGFFTLDRFSGKPLKTAGSRAGFAGELEWSKEDGLLFATSTAGYLYVMSTRFQGIVQRKNRAWSGVVAQ